MRGRDRHADLVRAVALVAVCVGHWSAIGVVGTGRAVDGINVLGELAWTHPLTWVLQVMPLFFLVAGWANAGSLVRHQQAGGGGPSWVVRRYRRLLVPSAVLLGTLVLAGALARGLGAGADVVARGLWAATVPLWFLAIYLAVLALAPAMLAAHRRWGMAVPLAGVVLVGASDLVRFHHGDLAVIEASFVVAWLAVHQVGFAWHDGRLEGWGPRAHLALAGGGAAALVAATVVGPYPVSMVRVPGAELHNSEPPTLALLALAATQIGLALALRAPVQRWLSAGRRYRPVARVNDVALSLFLWHMAAAVVVVAAVHGAAGVASPTIGSAPWLVLRLPWLAACAAVLVAVLGVVAPVERWARDTQAARAPAGRTVAWLGVLGCLAGLAGTLSLALAGSGVHGPLLLPTEAVVGVGAGAALVLLATRAIAVPPGSGEGAPVGSEPEHRRRR